MVVTPERPSRGRKSVAWVSGVALSILGVLLGIFVALQALDWDAQRTGANNAVSVHGGENELPWGAGMAVVLGATGGWVLAMLLWAQLMRRYRIVDDAEMTDILGGGSSKG